MRNNILLGVNIDHVATLRQARGTLYPEPLEAALIAERAGADGITLHLREDRRHIQLRDVTLFKNVLQTRMNLEMAVTAEMLKIAEEIRPHYCCLVPESREELTTEGGLAVSEQFDRIKDGVTQLTQAGVIASLFIDPDQKQIDAAFETGATTIEIHTGRYAEALDAEARRLELSSIIDAVEYARKAGLCVNAGHGLNYHNTSAIAAIPGIHELNIGHAIIARAIFSGMYSAVKEMKALIHNASIVPQQTEPDISKR